METKTNTDRENMALASNCTLLKLGESEFRINMISWCGRSYIVKFIFFAPQVELRLENPDAEREW